MNFLWCGPHHPEIPTFLCQSHCHKVVLCQPADLFAAGKFSKNSPVSKQFKNVWPCVLVLEPRLQTTRMQNLDLFQVWQQNNEHQWDSNGVCISATLQTLMMNHRPQQQHFPPPRSWTWQFAPGIDGKFFWSGTLWKPGQICKGYVKLPGLYNTPLKINGLFTNFPRFQLWWNFPF